MSKTCLPIALLGLLLAPWCAAAGDRLFIRDARIVDVVDGSVGAQQDVLIEDGRIATIGDLEPGDAEVIDGDGLYLVPGLIDGHVHLDGVPGMDWEQAQANPELVAEALQQIPRAWLYHGFTTLVDLNSNAERLAAWNAETVAPTAFHCGAAPVMDGYPTRFLPEDIRYRVAPWFLVDPAAGRPVPDGIDPADHTPAAVARAIADDGAVCIKTHWEDGFGARNDWPVPSDDLLRALVEAGEARDLPVLLHANSLPAQAAGARSGVGALVHGLWAWEDVDGTTPTGAVLDTLKMLAETGIPVQPTVQVLYGERDLLDPHYLERPAMAAVLPRTLLDWYAGDAGQSAGERMRGYPGVAELIDSGRWAEVSALPIKRVIEATRWLVEHDGVLLFGSDTPSDLTYANPPGLNARMEMDHWIAAGVTPARLLRAMTHDNAAFFGFDDLGTVEIGKQADLLLLGADPTKDVSAWDRIEWVILDGTPIARVSLTATR